MSQTCPKGLPSKLVNMKKEQVEIKIAASNKRSFQAATNSFAFNNGDANTQVGLVYQIFKIDVFF